MAKGSRTSVGKHDNTGSEHISLPESDQQIVTRMNQAYTMVVELDEHFQRYGTVEGQAIAAAHLAIKFYDELKQAEAADSNNSPE